MSYEVRYGEVIRTARSEFLKERRAVLQADATKYLYSAQEKADEKWLSRSKPYDNKGKKEAARRRARMAA